MQFVGKRMVSSIGVVQLVTCYTTMNVLVSGFGKTNKNVLFVLQLEGIVVLVYGNIHVK